MSQPEPTGAESAPAPPARDQRDARGLGVNVTVIRPACFRGDERLRCRNRACGWRRECCRLVAEWKR